VCSKSDLTACGSQCVDTNTDATNCGKCGSKCTSSQICTAGACTSCAGATLPSSGTVSYDGKATSSTKRPGSCGSSVDGVALSWAPPAGTYSVTLSSAGNVAADVYLSCSASSAQYCLSKGSPSAVSVPPGGSVIFFVRDADGASSAYTLTAKPVGSPPVP
jgi:hypothetical protein